MTPLAAALARQVRAAGPMSVADFMAACLTDPDHGYYMADDPLGVSGDFTTAPEISQMFGELLGLSLAEAWRAAGAPERIVLAELGPGRGTLMADLMRATRAVRGFHAAAEIVLVDVSPQLRAAQANALKAYSPSWVDTIEALPEGATYLIANEFFDALPIRQFRRSEAGWEEIVIGLSGGTLMRGHTAPVRMADLEHRWSDTRPGDIVETNASARAAANTIARRVAAHGGAALIIDYGDWRALGDTLQAMRHHAPADPLAEPGLADLTAHVDFEVLAQAAIAAGATHSRLTPQGVFLERLGITARAQALAKGLTGPALEAHIAAHRRLTHPSEMGTLFKVMSIHAADSPPPPGLEP